MAAIGISCEFISTAEAFVPCLKDFVGAPFASRMRSTREWRRSMRRKRRWLMSVPDEERVPARDVLIDASHGKEKLVKESDRVRIS
ncbi:hypothetical protein NKI38_08350 [Mesorhizobium sp. M0621]|uniref:hypothetical protein n=1 Tax=Mesorhizobium sp. M0621 TaxID=2956974 RepID=UPI00333B45AD